MSELERHLQPATPHRPTSTTPTRSRSSRASKRCASARACTSATPMTAPACTTWSTRSSTTRSTRRSPGTATHVDVVDPLRQLGHRRGQRPRHAGRHAPDREPPGAGSHHDGAARRRKVRPRQLQGLRRSARRRRLGGQRAVGVGQARDSARTARSTTRSIAAAIRPPSSSRPASPIAVGHQGHLQARPEDLQA